MLLYIAVPAIAILGHSSMLLSRVGSERAGAKKLFLIMAFVLPIFIYGFRDTVIGWDTVSYVDEFNVVGKVHLIDILTRKYTGYVLQDTEPGFLLLIWALARLGIPTWGFFIIIGVITNGLYIRAIYQVSPMAYASVISYLFLYNFLYGLSIMQQGLAAGILLNAYINIKRKEYIKYCASVMVATMFHVFSFVFLLLIIPTIVIKKKKQLIVVLVIAAVAIFKSLRIVELIVFRLFPHFQYFFRVNYHSDQTFGIGSTMYIVIDAVCIALLLKQYDSNKAISNEIVFLTMAMTLGGSTLVMMPVFGIYERISKFFHTFIIFGSAYALNGIRNKRWELLMIGGYSALTLVYYLYYVYMDRYDIVPFILYGG